MKKSFLIAGLIAGLTATNSYAAVVVSQDDAPDITISVARAAKLKNRDTNNLTTKPQKMDMVSDEPVVVINCPAGCTVGSCWTLGNVIMCQCKDANGNVCKPDDVINSSDTASSLR